MNALQNGRVWRATAIGAVGDYIAAHTDIYVRPGARSPTLEERSEHKRRVERVAEGLKQLSRAATSDDSVSYAQFEKHLTDLHCLGVYPLNPLVNNVAQAFHWLELDRKARA
jgi:hypothetical protein